jgi:nucleoid-associated protein YgaU
MVAVVPPAPTAKEQTPTEIAAKPPAGGEMSSLPATAQDSVPASMTGLITPTQKTPLDEPELWPVGDGQTEPAVDEAPAARPAYRAVIDGPGEAADEVEPPQSRVHVVHNGDTLGRLAKRYLGDEGRGLEIFDLNRDLLSNPHLLPIGAELRIPDDPRSADRSSAE